jgi:hypothetical protein
MPMWKNKSKLNTLRIFHLSFDPFGVAMRRKQIRKVWIFRYTIHILFIKIGHCIDAQLIFKSLDIKYSTFYSITSRDLMLSPLL